MVNIISGVLGALQNSDTLKSSLSSILSNLSQSSGPSSYFSKNIQNGYSDASGLDTVNLSGKNQIEQTATQTTQTTAQTEQLVSEENPNYSVEDFVKDDAEVSKRLDMAERQSRFEQVGTDIVGIDKLYYTSDPKKVVNDYEKYHNGYSYAKQKYSSMISQHDKEINNQMQQYSTQHPNSTKEELEAYKNSLETQYRANNYDYKTYIEAKEAYNQKVSAEEKRQNEIKANFRSRF